MKISPKRTNFCSIQQSHGIACNGYTQSPIRTGYEQIIAHRTSDLFAFTAKRPGKVISKNQHGMIIQYDDGDKKGIELGRRYGKSAGLTFPHDVHSDMQVGQVFKEGDLLCFNKGFFERDILNPNHVVWKAGIMVNVALVESPLTLEDSSTISQRVANLLVSNVTKVKDVVVTFDQSIRKLVKPGQTVKTEDILCIIEDEITANTGLFDEESLDTLRVVSAQTPLAKVNGEIERIEVYYHGVKEDMSESLRIIANAADAELMKRSHSIGKKITSGKVDDSFRINGDPLPVDSLVIRFYITYTAAMGEGDKGVFANQLKTVVGEIMPGEVKTETGKVVDALFGYTSIQARIVSSPDIIGTTNTLLEVIGQRAYSLYNS